ncbi:MAG: substrate-binding domain-containing protein, partial [Oscillospiraceae bacterium]|nr:substrate-binding domain-containing protein [Oscillospiraceae bacterium]
DHAAGRLAAQYLIDAGHTRIAGIFQSDDLQGHRRYSGYVDALTAAGLALQSANILWFTTEDIQYLSPDFDRVARCLEGCTGVVCYNDQIAYTVVSELRARFFDVPGDVSVVGVDNAELAAMCEVPLTTLNHPKQLLGELAAQNILRLIEDPDYDANVIFEPVLVERSSVKSLIDRAV